MRRGEIRVVEFGSSSGSGGAGARPAVVVSNDAANRTAARLGKGVITVVPVTPSVERIFPFQVLLPAAATGLPRDAKAQAEQLRTVPVERVGRRVGALPPAELRKLDAAIRIHLAL